VRRGTTISGEIARPEIRRRLIRSHRGPALLAFVLLTVVGTIQLPAALPPDEAAYQSANDALQDRYYAKAEEGFAEFQATYTNSPRLPWAILGQAKARLEQTNYAGAIQLLSARVGAGGALGDKYLMCLGDTYYRQGNNQSAAETFARLIKDYPASTNRLTAALWQARVYKRMSDWARVVDLLQLTNSLLQTGIVTNAAAREGYLLLGEAQFQLANYAAAETTLRSLKGALDPEMGWRWQDLLCRIQAAAGRPGDALQGTTNLVAQATATGQPGLLAQSYAFRASMFERLGNLDEAIGAYTNNLSPGTPGPMRWQAYVYMTDLYLRQNKLAEAVARLEQSLSQYSNRPAADIGWLTLGELQLRQHGMSQETNGAYLGKARDAFNGLARNVPQSPLLGKGQMYLGWCYWLDNKMPEAQTAFYSAVQHLPPGADQAFAYVKLADSQYKQLDYTNALKNYFTVVEKFQNLPEAKSNLLERVLYQAVMAAKASTNLAAGTDAVGKLLAWYPSGFHTDRAVLMMGQEVSRQGNPASARKILFDFINAAPTTPKLPEVHLAIARTYEEEMNWAEAIQQYRDWLAIFTNHPARPQAAYSFALATAKGGDEPAALRYFTNFVAQFRTSEFRPRAELWVGNYYYNQGGPDDLINAETYFQTLSLSTNVLGPYAEMMAGFAVQRRQGWSDAKQYFTHLANRADCPPDLKWQARFALADLLGGGDKSPSPDYETAIRLFKSIIDEAPATNALVVAAWGRKAECLWQYAARTKNERDFQVALDAFQQVTNFPNADPAMLAQSKFGQARVLEDQASRLTGDDKTKKRLIALNLYLDVLYNEKALHDDGSGNLLRWTQRAGLQAGDLAEVMEDWSHAKSIYQRLENVLPVLRPSLDKRILKVQEKLDAEEKGQQ
jgi:TolA-binding protein